MVTDEGLYHSPYVHAMNGNETGLALQLVPYNIYHHNTLYLIAKVSENQLMVCI